MEINKCCSNSQESRKRSHKKLSPSFTFTNIWKKIERLIFNSLFKYIDENELLNPNQSGFHPFDSCVNQLLSTNRKIFSNFECDPPN